MITLHETDCAYWLAITADDEDGFAFVRGHIAMFGSRRWAGEIYLMIEHFRIDGFLRFCHKHGIEVNRE